MAPKLAFARCPPWGMPAADRQSRILAGSR
jgi:hypothetical protein